MATFDHDRKKVSSDIEDTMKESGDSNKENSYIFRFIFLFNCLAWISAVSPLYFPEDQQEEARVLIKEVKERLHKLRSMGVPK